MDPDSASQALSGLHKPLLLWEVLGSVLQAHKIFKRKWQLPSGVQRIPLLAGCGGK